MARADSSLMSSSTSLGDSERGRVGRSSGSDKPESEEVRDEWMPSSGRGDDVACDVLVESADCRGESMLG